MIVKQTNRTALAQAGIWKETVLCKYRPLDAKALAILGGRELYFAPSSSFNDPFDCDVEALVEGSPDQLQAIWEKLRLDVKALADAERLKQIRFIDLQSEPRAERGYPYVRDFELKAGIDSVYGLVPKYSARLRNAREGSVEYATALREFYHSLIQIGQRQFGICCLAGDAANILMWSHYAANHTGVALLFDSSRRLFVKQPGISQHDVRYHQSRKVNVAEEGWPGSFIQLFTRKAVDWAYEKESRYVSHTGPGSKQFKRSALRGIVFGCRFKENLQVRSQRDFVEELFYRLAIENEERISGPQMHFFVAEKKVGAFSLAMRRLPNVNAVREYFSYLLK